jgi:putative ABC transport system permease protein
VPRDAWAVVLAGIAVGVRCALVASHVVANRLFGVSPGDLPTIATVALVLLSVALLASCLPAR